MTDTTTRPVFTTGCRYWTRSIVDSDHVIEYEVVKRTPKTVVLRRVRDGELTNDSPKRCRIKSNWQGVEMVEPWGSYSMSPSLTADKCR